MRQARGGGEQALFDGEYHVHVVNAIGVIGDRTGAGELRTFQLSTLAGLKSKSDQVQRDVKPINPNPGFVDMPSPHQQLRNERLFDITSGPLQ
jgi:hypothetical protein